MVTVKGRYVFDQAQIDNETFEYTGFTFTSNGQTFYGIKLEPYQPGAAYLNLYYINEDGTYTHVAFQDGDWDTNWDFGDGYKTIDFGDGAIVPEHLKNWLDWSATWQMMVLKAGTYKFNDVINGSYIHNYDLGELMQQNHLSDCSCDFVYNDEHYNVLQMIGMYAENEGKSTQAYTIIATDYNFETQTFVKETRIFSETYLNGVLTEDSVGYEVPTPVIIVLETDQEVSEILGRAFIGNSDYNEINGNLITLKAGTYKYNAVLNCKGLPTPTSDALLETTPVYYEVDMNFGLGEYSAEASKIIIWYFSNMGEPLLWQLGYLGTVYYGGEVIASDMEAPIYNYHNDLPEFTDNPQPTKWLSQEYEMFGATDEDLQRFTIPKDLKVIKEIGNWIIENSNYNEVNPPTKSIAEITYNGETIAQLNAGETATLSCKGKKMASDVVVKVNKVDSGENGNVVPLIAEQNGTYTYTYETATETVDVNTQWEFMPNDNNGKDDEWVGFKKATNFIIPRDIGDIKNKAFYMRATLKDGTTNTLYFGEMDDMTTSVANGATLLNYCVLLVEDSEDINTLYNTTYFESHTVYTTNVFWLVLAFAGLDFGDAPKMDITFTSKLIENASFYPVTVDVEPNVTTKTITSNGTYAPTGDVVGYSSVIVDVPAKIIVTELPTENANSKNVYEMDGALYKLNTNILTGAWAMAKNPNVMGIHNGESRDVNFTCNGQEYTSFDIMYDNWDYHLYYVTGASSVKVYDDSEGWLDDSYRNVIFTGENDTILTWLNGNGSEKTSGKWVKYSTSSLPKISGVWKINATPTISEGDPIYEGVTFTSEYPEGTSNTYYGMGLMTYTDDYTGEMVTSIYYIPVITRPSDVLQVYDTTSTSGAWKFSETLQTVDFGETEQVVSQKFYDLFTSIATKQ